nr:hypothetical protein CFP56_37341 [Quercus suber]
MEEIAAFLAFAITVTITVMSRAKRVPSQKKWIGTKMHSAGGVETAIAWSRIIMNQNPPATFPFCHALLSSPDSDLMLPSHHLTLSASNSDITPTRIPQTLAVKRRTELLSSFTPHAWLNPIRYAGGLSNDHRSQPLNPYAFRRRFSCLHLLHLIPRKISSTQHMSSLRRSVHSRIVRVLHATVCSGLHDMLSSLRRSVKSCMAFVRLRTASVVVTEPGTSLGFQPGSSL